MKQLLAAAFVFIVFSVSAAAQSQDKAARKLAERLAVAFSADKMKRLDAEHLLDGRLQLSIQNWIAEPEFESKSFRSFTAMERWLKADENEPGFPIRTSGEKLSCRRGLCRLDLVDNQMAHNHVFLTRMWYSTVKGKIRIKKIRLLYG